MALLYHRPTAGAKRSADGDIATGETPDDECCASDSAEQHISLLLNKLAGSTQSADPPCALPVLCLIIVCQDEENMTNGRAADDDSFIKDTGTLQYHP